MAHLTAEAADARLPHASEDLGNVRLLGADVTEVGIFIMTHIPCLY